MASAGTSLQEMEEHEHDSGVVTPRHVAIAIIPHITGFLSIAGSLFIVVDVLRDDNKIRKSTYHRLMLGMSFSDVLASSFLFLSSWPIPKGSSGVFAAMGNVRTCEAQGFFVQLGVATFIYSGYLAIYFLLVMKYRWKPTDFDCLERAMHIFAITIAIGTAIAALCLQLYNSANLWCWIAPYPLDCLNSSQNEGTTTCERGDNAYIYRVAFYFIWLWIAVIAVFYCMITVFWMVYSQRRTMRRWNPDPSASISQRGDQLVRDVAIQSTLYVVAFLLTAVFPSLVRMFQAKWNCTTTFFPLTILTVTFFPLQGFWNFLIYIRPRYATARKEHPEWSIYQCVQFTFGRTLGLKLPENDNKDYQLGYVSGAAASEQKDGVHEVSNESTEDSYLSSERATKFGGSGGKVGGKGKGHQTHSEIMRIEEAAFDEIYTTQLQAKEYNRVLAKELQHAPKSKFKSAQDIWVQERVNPNLTINEEEEEDDDDQ